MKKVKINDQEFKEVCEDCGNDTFFVKGEYDNLGTIQICSNCGDI